MFENQSRNDLETNLQVTLKSTKLSRIIIGVAALITLASGILILVLELMYPKSEPDYFTAVIMMVMGVLFTSFFLFYKPFFRMILKKTMQGKEGVNFYRFSENGYEISTTLNDGTTGTTNGNYFAVTQCKEYSEFWLLYLNKATYFIVEKSGMKEGAAEELTRFFQNKFNGKYKLCYKKK